LPQFTEAALVAMVQPQKGETPFMRWGNAAALVIAVAMLVIGVAAGRRKT
jgi:apolipoprotein N-acyltransferase